MTIRQTNFFMRSAATFLLAGGAMVLLWSIATPLEEPKAIPERDAIDHSPPLSATSDLPPLDQFTAVFNANLRGQELSPSAPVTSAAGLTLVGTIGDRVALVRSGDTTEAHIVGERFDGGEVIAVRSGEADLQTSAGVFTLRKQADDPTPEYIHGGTNP